MSNENTTQQLGRTATDHLDRLYEAALAWRALPPRGPDDDEEAVCRALEAEAILIAAVDHAEKVRAHRARAAAIAPEPLPAPDGLEDVEDERAIG